MSYQNDWHVFFGCEKLAAVWEAIELWRIIKENLEVSYKFVSLFKLLEQLPNQQLLIFVMSLWYIWKRRNEKQIVLSIC